MLVHIYYAPGMASAGQTPNLRFAAFGVATVHNTSLRLVEALIKELERSSSDEPGRWIIEALPDGDDQLPEHLIEPTERTYRHAPTSVLAALRLWNQRCELNPFISTTAAVRSIAALFRPDDQLNSEIRGDHERN